MDLAMAPLTMQLTAFEQMVLSNPVTKAIVERMPQLGLPGCYLAAGALFQTVWNCLDGRDQQAGINDYDINYTRPQLGCRRPGHSARRRRVR
jgi:hypothetical protein